MSTTNQDRQKAREELDAMLAATRPKNLQQGVGKGLSSVVGGALGGIGIAVLSPIAGARAGHERGGILGGIAGGAGGAVTGLLGGATIAVGGAVSGLANVARGVAAVPGQVSGPMTGKWWNQAEGKWVYTDLNEEAIRIVGESVPKDDSDIVGSVKEKIDDEAGASNNHDNDKVVDSYYYDILDVPSNADESTIKRRYYVLARKYHPDKNKDDKDACEKFEKVSEAYQVLSDQSLRKLYNEQGREALSPDKTSAAEAATLQLDPKLLFAFLFGSEKFHDWIGDLSTATSHSVGDSSQIGPAEARKLQKRRVTRLALNLVNQVDVYNDKNAEKVEQQWRDLGKDLVEASFGHQLLTTIGKTYSLVATMYLGSASSGNGLPSLSKWAKGQQAKIQSDQASQDCRFQTLKAGFDMAALTQQLEQKMQVATTAEEKQKINKQLQEAASEALLRILWTTTVVDITSTLMEACQMVFNDHAVEKEQRVQRAKAVKKLGEIWMAIPGPTNIKDTQQLYEEAAFAAMVETAKRNDEAAHAAQ